MSANKKIILIIILGAGATLFSFISSQYFSEKIHANQALLSRIQRFSANVASIHLLSNDFIQNLDPVSWDEAVATLKRSHVDLALSPSDGRRWQGTFRELEDSLTGYHRILARLYDPATRLKEEKAMLQGIGLSFSEAITARIIQPYRSEEGLRIYRGDAIDPFKTRVKDTAYDLAAIHTQQQLILLELLLDRDLPAYLKKKDQIATKLEQHKAQLQFMSILMGRAPDIQATIENLESQLDDLVNHEKVIVDLFSMLSTLNADLHTAGERLIDASRHIAASIVEDTRAADRLNRMLSWGLLVLILGALGLMGALLAADIIRFVKDLDRQREALRTSERNLKVTLDSIGDAVIATDQNGMITRLNPTAERLTGWTADTAVGQPLPSVFHIVNANTRKGVSNPVDKVLAEGQVIGLANHTVLLSRDGSEYQIADSGAPIRATDGRIIGVVLVFRDVTESYAQEQKIRDSEKQLKEITANVPGVLFQFKVLPDNSFSIEFINEKAFSIFGLKPDTENVFRDFTDHLPAADKDRFLASVQVAVKNGIPWHYEGRFIKPSGETIWFSGTSNPVRSGEVLFFNGLVMDITRRRELEDSLRTTQLCVDLASIGIFRIGDDARILDVNQKACNSLGYTKAELCRMTVFDVDPNFDPDIWPAHLENIKATGNRTIETLHRHKNGTVFPVEIMISHMSFAEQAFHVAFVQDITARKAAEQEAKRLQTALVQSQKMEAIGTLAGGIAHDFNNILSAVMGYTQLALKDAEPTSRLHDQLQQVYTAGLRAADLVRQILTFSRQTEQKQTPVSLAPLVKEALKLLRSSLPATIAIEQRIDERTENVMANPTQIHQIVMNLCTNAAHAMEETGGSITVSLDQIILDAADPPPGAYVRLRVTDSGNGMPPEVMEKIFDPYFTTKASGKGTGLGLSVVHGIVRGLNGSIAVDSRPGVGSTFTVHLPAHTATAAETDNRREIDLPTGSETILLVDDESILVELGREQLHMLGYRVLPFTDSRSALERFKQAPGAVDLIISDMTMPKMTGDRLAVQMLAIRPDLPIIICTGFSSELTEQKALDIGVKALLHKPLIAETLAVTVRRVLDAR